MQTKLWIIGLILVGCGTRTVSTCNEAIVAGFDEGYTTDDCSIPIGDNEQCEVFYCPPPDAIEYYGTDQPPANYSAINGCLCNCEAKDGGTGKIWSYLPTNSEGISESEFIWKQICDH